MRKVYICLLLLAILFSSTAYSQSGNGDWPHIPGFTSEIIGKKQTAYGILGAAAISFTLAELVSKNTLNLNYYQSRLGINNEHFWGLRKVFHQNAGVEKRVTHWFATAAEINLQQWSDRTPNIESSASFGIGSGIMTYYRWYLMGKKRISPYLEYGVGLFHGFEKFPRNGTHFTFNHSLLVGIEYTLANKNKLRLGYGYFHQSTGDYLQPNPGYNADGFSISYAWFWQKTQN